MAPRPLIFLWITLALASCGNATDAAKPVSVAVKPADVVCKPTATVSGADEACTATVGNDSRYFFLTLPPAADVSAPVLFNFHGFSSNPAQQNEFSGLPAKAKAEGFILATPGGFGTNASGLGFGGWNGGTCCTGGDDLSFIKKVLDYLLAERKADPKRIYSTGLSNGGILSYRLACDLSDRIAAIAPVAGADMTATCLPKRAVPVLAFHGTADGFVPYGGGHSGIAGGLPTIYFPSVTDSIGKWVMHDGCLTQTSVVFQKGEATCVAHKGCKAGSEVTLCTLVNGGHTWPGGNVGIAALGATNNDLNANDFMFDFFRAHVLP